MRTVTITLHDTINSGSSLQSFALQRFLQNNGIENEIIDYVPEYIENNGRFLKTLIRKVLYHRETKQQKLNFKAFNQKFLKVTSTRYRNYDQLIKNPPVADCYLAGSDQIWNAGYACGRDPAFYLAFTDKAKIAYAASIGREDVPDTECKIYTQYVKNYYAVSVREKTTKNMLEKLLDIPIEYVCDPVLLNPVETYRSMESPKLLDEPYALVYLVKPGEMLEQTIQYIRKAYKCKIVVIGGFREKCSCDLHLKSIGPQNFLSLIDNSTFVLSGSFHATVFSHIFQKDFAVILPERNQARMVQFLEVSGLQNQIIRDKSNISQAIKKVEFSDPTKRLNVFSDASKQWLLDKLKGVAADEK